eukprot:4904054-Alexandrium_andersonii.AAC.1
MLVRACCLKAVLLTCGASAALLLPTPRVAGAGPLQRGSFGRAHSRLAMGSTEAKRVATKG